MKRSAFLTLLSVILPMGTFAMELVVIAHGTTTINVYLGDFIQEAINSAQPGDTVYVHEGTYYEHLIVNKPIGIIGSKKGVTVIDGSGMDTVIHIEQAIGVNISGLTIRNSGGYSYLSENYGIHLMDCGRCNISRNVIEQNYYGIGLTNSSKNSVSTNDVFENSCGIRLSGSTENVISQNTLSQNLPGIELRNSSKNEVSNNIIRNGSYYPISLTQSSNENSVIGNSISNNTGRVYISTSDYNIIDSNFLTQNKYGGIDMYEARHNTVVRNNITSSLEEDLGAVHLCKSENNLITKNNLSTKRVGIDLLFADSNILFRNRISQASFWGIGLGHSNNNSIVLNTVKDSKRAILMSANASYGHSNKIFHNNFISNINQTDLRGTNNNSWDNGVEGNYWSDYIGQDLNKDIIGDSPYIIDENNQDNFPLMGIFSEFTVMDNGDVFSAVIICNSLISEFKFDSSDDLVSFVTEVREGITLARICVPKAILSDPLGILINGDKPTTQEELSITNSTHIVVYFTYEFPSNPFWMEPWFWMILILGTVITISAITSIRRREAQIPKAR